LQAFRGWRRVLHWQISGKTSRRLRMDARLRGVIPIGHTPHIFSPRPAAAFSESPRRRRGRLRPGEGVERE